MPVLECAVHWAAPADEPGMRALLDDGERDRYDRFLRKEDKARFVTGRFLARTTLAGITGLDPGGIRFTTDCPHCGGAHGKPRLPGHDLDFSLSHSGDRVVLAVAEGAMVGVDVERENDRDIDRLAAMVLAAPERDVFAALPSEQRKRAFHRYWSRKEAILKATGHGLAAPMTAIHLSAPGDPAEVLAWDGDAAVSPVRLADLATGPGYAAAVAVLTPRPLKVTAPPSSADARTTPGT
ncbi:4'-phosphopantetheinyl transferase superfamily protein [Actinomadura sp. 7K507]|uniref:4'-phosphopantetheinyl transferase family protein n=1 Tax=Actinomadura sp. 7K507 TaxID=2530365 RepID=UPI00104A0477|nr:4'-phosphopantetheinyl transferase superfamily protein [Actinomadura sp. 7K507]TDC91265.1 4'-phosphopantetheinyl transferase superfamily protein [Actinomadura sp. 7K507]